MADLKSYNIPESAELMLISPGDNDSQFLLEVPDLKMDLLKDAAGKDKGENGK
jgi:hypothetical protein